MHVLIVTYIYPPEHAPAGINARELAEALAQRGHQVTILTGWPSHPKGTLYPGWKAKLLHEEKIGVRTTLVRCIHSFQPRLKLTGKMYYYLTFAISSFLMGMRIKKIDVVLIQSTPLFGVTTAILLGKLKCAKIFYWVNDVHPESAINSGMLRNAAIARLMKAIDTWACQSSDIVGTLTDDMQLLLLHRGLHASKVIVQRNWVNESRIYPSDRENPWRMRHGLSRDTFVVLYAGTIGFISGAEVVIDAAQLLRENRRILFLIVGEGPVKGKLEALARKYNLSNTRFLPFQEEQDLNFMQATGDVGLVTLLPKAGESSIPSKMYGYAAAGRPVIACVADDSSTAKFVRDNDLGWVVPPCDGDALAGAIQNASLDQEACHRKGENARRFFVGEFGRKVQSERFCAILETLG